MALPLDNAFRISEGLNKEWNNEEVMDLLRRSQGREGGTSGKTCIIMSETQSPPLTSLHVTSLPMYARRGSML